MGARGVEVDDEGGAAFRDVVLEQVARGNLVQGFLHIRQSIGIYMTVKWHM